MNTTGSGTEASAGTSGAWTSVGLRLLTLRAEVQTNLEPVAEFCRDLFARFVDSRETPAYILRIERTGADSWRVRDPTIDAVFHDGSWTTGVVAARLLETAGNQVDGYDLFHGAAVSSQGRGLIVSGESGFGKSVLTLSLLRRGWKFFSDEVAVLDAKKAELSAFPKAIEVRTEAARLVGLTSAVEARRAGKFLQDPEELFPGCLAEPCPLGAVVFLEAAEDNDSTAATDALRLSVHRRVAGMEKELSGLKGVKGVSWEGGGDEPHTLVIRHEPGSFAAWSLDEVLGRHGVLILGSSADERPPVDFTAEPRLEPLERHAGVNKLLGRFRGRRALARRIDSCENGFGELFLSLLTRLKDVKFYRLKVGRLERSLSLLEQALL